VYCFAPRMPGAEGGVTTDVAMPSLPIANTPYRLTLPLVSRRTVNNVVKRLSIVHAHSMFVTGWAGLRYARRYGMPIVYTYHTQLEAYAHYVPFDAKATRFAAGQLTRTFGNFVDAVVVPTPAMARHLRNIGVETRIEVVPSGIDVERFGLGKRDPALRKKLRIRSGQRMVLVVSRLAREKNIDVVLQALARANEPDLKLIVAGDGPAREELEALALALGVADAVTFLGVVARELLPDLYASADAFVFPSTSETQGLVQAEALAAGAYAIVADSPPNREVVGTAARIVTATPAAFAKALRAVPAVPSEDVAARGKAAARRFGIALQSVSIIELYRSLLLPRPEGYRSERSA
jgi:1,2-diacylglycerol 3-alpha-glucosyltransferase